MSCKPTYKGVRYNSIKEIETLLNSIKSQYKNENLKDNKTPIIKTGVEELFDSNPKLANQVYSKILTNSGISAENLLFLLLKDNLIEKQCS